MCEMRWAVVTHPWQWCHGRLLYPPRCIPETGVPIAVEQGWTVLLTDSEFLPAASDMNVQSNPRRRYEPGED